MDKQPKKKPRKSENLEDTVSAVLRREVIRLESQVRSLERDLAARENEHAILVRSALSAEEEARVLLEAIRILSRAIQPTTSEGRRVRQEARQLLESRKISPPSTLGSSRNRGKRTRGNRKGLTPDGG